MVRNYVRKTNRQSWSEDNMKKAVIAVIEGKLGHDAASEAHEVPHTTLQERVQKVKDGKIDLENAGLKSLGHYKMVFSNEQEKDLVEYLKDMESRLFGLTQHHLRKLAFELAERNNINHNFNKTVGMAGQDWLRGFLSRHKELSVRAPEPTSAYLKAATPKNAMSGFRATGINPFNPYIFDSSDFAPAETTNITEISDSTTQLATDYDTVNVSNNVTSKPSCSTDNTFVSTFDLITQPNCSADTNFNRSNSTIQSRYSTDNIVASTSGFSVQPSGLKKNNIESFFTDLTTDIPSANKNQTFSVSPQVILPIPKSQNINRSSRRRGKTAIITESPYKNELEAIKEKTKPLAKKRIRTKSIKKILFKSKNSSDSSDEESEIKKLCVSTDDNDSVDEECIYCSMPYKEDTRGEKWVKCINCCRWCHELCGGVENWKNYSCDLCVKT